MNSTRALLQHGLDEVKDSRGGLGEGHTAWVNVGNEIAVRVGVPMSRAVSKIGGKTFGSSQSRTFADEQHYRFGLSSSPISFMTPTRQCRITKGRPADQLRSLGPIVTAAATTPEPGQKRLLPKARRQ